MNDAEIVARLRAITMTHKKCHHTSSDVDGHECSILDSIGWLAARIEQEAAKSTEIAQ